MSTTFLELAVVSFLCDLFSTCHIFVVFILISVTTVGTLTFRPPGQNNLEMKLVKYVSIYM